MIFKITINDTVNEYSGIDDAVEGINNTLFELTSNRRANLDVTLTELLTFDIFKDALYTTGIRIPGTRLNDDLLEVRVQVILPK